MKFFSFWRSQASFRVRIALNLKKLPAEVVFVDLDADAHRADDFRRVNPQMALPALVEDDGTVLFQSLAIIEYLDETHPDPAAAAGRCARPRPGARAGADRRLRGPPAAGAADPPLSRSRAELARHRSRTAWRRHWTVETLTALEGHLAGHKDTGRFCHGDAPRIADICLVGHVTVAVTQQIDLAPWPTVKRIFETAMALPEFATAHPLAQPDTPEAMRPKA